MPTFYKIRGTELATVIYDGDVFYDFIRTEPDLFEHKTEDPKAIKFLTKAGYPIKEETPPEVALANLTGLSKSVMADEEMPSVKVPKKQ